MSGKHDGELSPAASQAPLEERIVAALSGLSRKQKEIARFVLDNQEIVAFSSASELGGRTDSSAATVVRFCQALGYKGYIDLQSAVRDQVSRQWPAVRRFQERLDNPLPKEDLVARAFSTDIHNIERTAERTADDRLQAAAGEIRRARQILVVGGGLTSTVVGFFAHALQVIGLPVQCVAGGGEPLALALAFLRPEDVVIGVGFWRNLRDVVQAIEQAQEIGATTIGITDSRLSPLARLPDHHFLVATSGVAHNLSPVATLSLLNTLVATLSFDMPERVVESLHMVDEAYRRSGLLAE